MGNKIFKKTGNHRRESILPPNDIHIYDDKVVDKLREDLNNEPEKFLLNNIFLSIQFYENFEREMEELRTNQVSKREMEINKTLADYKKHCLLPDTVMDYINERVRFRPFHGPNKFQSETLIPQRMYIVHDNIEVQYKGETSEYSVVDGPIHRAIIERAEKQGYVQLRQIELVNAKGYMDAQDSDEEDEQSERTNAPSSPSALKDSPLSSPGVNSEKTRLFTKSGSTASSPLMKESPVFFQTDNLINEIRRTSLKKKLFKSQSFSLSLTNQNSGPIVKTKASQSDENISKLMDKYVGDDDYGYTTFTRISTQKPLDEVRAKRNPSNASSLSQFCITEVKERKIIPDDVNDSDTDSLLENERRKPPVKKNIQEFYEIKNYFNSVEFFAHFGDVFANIYTLLQFTEESFRKAMAQGGAIHCENVDQNHKVWYEVIPTVSTPWPEIAFEWHLRQRRAVLNPTDNMVYQWPTKNMVNKIKLLQSNVLPYGYVAKRGLHKNSSLEWSLAFPAAERYMQTCMSHAQVRCYLFILALYKTFMEPTNTKLGLAPHHIRTLMFWEIENNYVTWPEERLGSKIISILKNLYKHLALANLPDYFIRERNLLENTPRIYLSKSQEKLHRILERPVLHVLLAMRNLRYTTGSFFPPLNFKKLYNIITTSNSLSIVNPALAIMLVNNTKNESEEEPNEFEENKIPFWKRARNVDYGRIWKRKVRKQIELQKKLEDEKLANKRKVSVDSINLQENISPLDSIKRRALLEFFIEHLIAVATKCNSYGANKYALLILNHCKALAMLLGEEPSGEIEARTWKLKIKEKIQMCVESKDKAEVYSVRDSRQFTATTLNISDHHSLNMQNLNNTFNSSSSLQLGPPKKKKFRQQNVEVSAEVHPSKQEQPTSITLNDTNENSTDL